MDRLFVRSLPYTRDSAGLFSRIAGLPGAAFLDSGRLRGARGSCDVLTALPRTRISSRDGVTEVRGDGEARVYRNRDPFELVREQLGPLEVFGAYPFLTGAIGYFSYDLGRRIETLPEIARDEERLPELMLGIYDWAVVVDHDARQATLLGLRGVRAGDDGAFEDVRTLLEGTPAGRAPGFFRALGPPCANMSKREYLDKFDRVRRYICDGDCYQVNLAQKFLVEVEGDAWDAYRRLRETYSAPFSAYLNFGDFQVLSFSPERFLRVRAGHVETKPIKGTCARGVTPREDFARIEALRNSAKDRSENLMIVDLLRNDVSKNCRPGSVKVSRLFDVESFANVHHLVSTVEGDLEPGRDVFDLLRGCFPGGSITGAPKLRSMEIIEELEPDRRGVYCGAIGYISRHGNMDLNVAIRTAVHRGGNLSFFAGGGLVADSEGESEYQETMDKVSPMFALLGAPSGGEPG